MIAMVYWYLCENFTCRQLNTGKLTPLSIRKESLNFHLLDLRSFISALGENEARYPCRAVNGPN